MFLKCFINTFCYKLSTYFIIFMLHDFSDSRYLRTVLTKSEMKYFGSVVAITTAMLLLILIVLTYAGVVAPWSGRFYSLWDTGYAKIHIPIIASVSEHQPTTWFSFFFDLHVLVALFPVGLWYCITHVNDERVFGKNP